MATMTSDLKFDLPPRVPQRKGRGLVGILLALVAGAAGGFLARPLIRPAGREAGPPHAGATLLTPSELTSLAEELERNQLYAQAADMWIRAGEVAPPAPTEKAERLFRIGRNLHLAGRYEQGLAYLLAAEAADANGLFRAQINRLVLEGLSALGKQDVREYQARRRTSLDPADKDRSPAVLAEIGGEPITEADLRGFVRRMAVQQLGGRPGSLASDSLEKAVEEQVRRWMETPDGRRQMLQAYIGNELLYREAVAATPADDRDVQEQLTEARRQILTRTYLDRYLVKDAPLSEADIRDAYEAHKDEYVEPEAVKVEAIAVTGQAAREEIDKALQAGTDFDELARRHAPVSRPAVPSDAEAAAMGPALSDRWIERDGFLPFVTDSRAALAHLFTLQPGEVSPKWFAGPGGQWVRFRLRDRRPQRVLALDECRPRVERDLRVRRRDEAMQRLEQELQRKYNVVIRERPTGR